MDGARVNLRDVLGRPSRGGAGPARFVRIRRAASDEGTGDLNSVVRPGLAAIMAPKVRLPDEVEWLADQLDALERGAKIKHGTVRIVPSIESAAALLEAPRIASASDRVVGLAFGSEDFALDLGLPTKREGEAADLLYARSATVIASVSAGKRAFDGIWPDIKDATGLRADALRAGRLGFSGKTLIPPDQIAVGDEVFSPTPPEVEEAQRAVGAVAGAVPRRG